MPSCVKPSSGLVLFGIILIVSLASAIAQTSSTAANTPCNTYGLAAEYDVIVVGSGPGGSVAARRLAENNPHLQVLQIERGIPYTSCEYCSSATHVFLNGEQPNTHLVINTAPQTHLPGSPVIPFIDASVQGGASSINGVYACRGTANYFYDTFWPSNWSWDIMQEFFRTLESYYFPQGMYGPGGFDYAANIRGTNGPVKITEKSALDQNSFIKHFDAAAAAVLPGLPVLNNGSCNNGNHPGIGCSPTETTTYQDTRSSAWASYLQSFTASNLKTISLTRVNKVLFSGTQVTGVQITQVTPANATSGGLAIGKTCTVSSSNVVLSAGAVGTPKILLQSGIGPKALLNSLNIPIVVDNENVGANLHDHYGLLIPTTSGPVPVSNDTANDWAWAFWNEANNASLPITFDIQYTTSGDFGAPFGYMNPNRVFADSVGEVSITSSNPDVAAYLDFNYLSTANDKNIMAYALEKALAIMQTLGLSGANPCTTSDCSTPLKTLDAYIEAGYTTPGYHLTGTAAICSVVNPNHLNVKGTQGLYVLDGSMFPLSPSCNSQVPIYASSERGVLLIQDAILNGCTETAADYDSC